MTSSHISERSGRIAKNTVLLYFRMLLMLVIGLYTSRVVLQALGIDDYGVFQAVGDVVAVFTALTASISAAITRFLSGEIGKGDSEKLKSVFSTSVIIQIALCVVVAIMAETLGMYLLERKMTIPEGSIGDARIVLHLSLGALVLNMLSVPFNSCIIAHEKMQAFAVISIIEAALKLLVAILITFASQGKLVWYASLLLAVSLIVRLTYGLYCSRNFPESRGGLRFDGSTIKEMAGFAGWNFFGSSAYVLNTRGAGILSNYFFGVAVNTARGVAFQVENIVKQFVSNFLTALNPQIYKSYASGEKDYCQTLVTKGAKYSILIILFFLIPLYFESEPILRLWLGADAYPDTAPLFVRLTIICLLIDMSGNSVLQMILASGKIRNFYITSGLISYLMLPALWLAFRLGAPASAAYLAFMVTYIIVFAIRLISARRHAGLNIPEFLKEGVLPPLEVAAFAFALTALPYLLVRNVWLRLVLVLAVSTVATAASTWLLALTKGEKEFIYLKLGRFLPTRLYLRWRYRVELGKKLHLRHPVALTEIIQWQKAFDHNPLYHTLVDKVEVKKWIDSRLGPGYSVPTLGVWDRPEDIEWDNLPDSFVLKCSHDSGSTIVCTDKAHFDKDAAIKKLRGCMEVDYYRKSREWAYKGLTPKVLAESYLGDDPADYKFFCSYGSPKFMFIATERGSVTEETKFDFYDMDFNHLDVRNNHPNAETPPSKPRYFEQMKDIAAKLSEGMRQVRIDLYEVGGKIYFGEFTFYHWAGYKAFDPDEWDTTFGKWLGR